MTEQSCGTCEYWLKVQGMTVVTTNESIGRCSKHEVISRESDGKDCPCYKEKE